MADGKGGLFEGAITTLVEGILKWARAQFVYEVEWARAQLHAMGIAVVVGLRFIIVLLPLGAFRSYIPHARGGQSQHRSKSNPDNLWKMGAHANLLSCVAIETA
jgi:hypothetical protein